MVTRVLTVLLPAACVGWLAASLGEVPSNASPRGSALPTLNEVPGVSSTAESQPAGAPELKLLRYAISSGGAVNAGGTLVLSATVGEAFVGIGDGGDHSSAGFWFVPAAGDCNVDSDVNGQDYSAFSICLRGPSDPHLSGGCGCYDANQSGRVDLRDFSILQTQYTGD